MLLISGKNALKGILFTLRKMKKVFLSVYWFSLDYSFPSFNSVGGTGLVSIISKEDFWKIVDLGIFDRLLYNKFFITIFVHYYILSDISNLHIIQLIFIHHLREICCELYDDPNF